MSKTLLTKSQGEKCQYLVCFSLLHVSSQFPVRLTEHRIDVPSTERSHVIPMNTVRVQICIQTRLLLYLLVSTI